MRLDLVHAKALIDAVLPRVQQDFNIPKPSDIHVTPPPVSASPLGGFLPPIATGPSTTEIIIGVAVALVAAGLFLLVRGVLFSHLIDRRVPPSSARGASWAFYAFLTITAWTAIAGFVVGLWSSIPFLAGGATLSLATLIFFVVSYSGALHKVK
jgi:hypothetical protein